MNDDYFLQGNLPSRDKPVAMGERLHYSRPKEIRPVKLSKFTRRRGFLKLLTAASRKGRSDDDDDPPPCPAVISPAPRLPPSGMQAELEAA